MANWTICEHSVNRFLNCSRVVVGQEGRRLRLPNEGWPNLKPTANVLSGLILQLPYTPHTCKMAASNDNFAIFWKRPRVRALEGLGVPSKPPCLLHRPQNPKYPSQQISVIPFDQSNASLFALFNRRLVLRVASICKTEWSHIAKGLGVDFCGKYWLTCSYCSSWW